MQCLKHEATFDQVKHCVQLLEQGSVANRGVQDGDYYQQLFGMIAQTIVADIVGEKRPECRSGPDEGHDVVINGVKLDVKCVLREHDPKMTWACNLTYSQAKYNTDGYIFISYNRGTGQFHILGWTTKAEYLAKAKLNKIGDRIVRDDGTILVVQHMPFYELPIKRLHRIKTHNDLKSIKLKGRN